MRNASKVDRAASVDEEPWNRVSESAGQTPQNRLASSALMTSWRLARRMLTSTPRSERAFKFALALAPLLGVVACAVIDDTQWEVVAILVVVVEMASIFMLYAGRLFRIISAAVPLIAARTGMPEELVSFQATYYPEVIIEQLGSPRGLMLCFTSEMGVIDRLLVDAIIYSVLGRDSLCRIAELAERGGSTTVRLECPVVDELIAVAEALYNRVWELQERAQRTTLAQLAQALAPQTVNVNAPVGTQIIVQNATFGLYAELTPVVSRLQKLQDALGASPSDLVDRLERMELRLPSEDAAADQTAAATARRELKLVRTWDPSTHPRTALDRLLAMLEPDELRLLLARGPDGAEVVALVPAGAVAPMLLASQAADALVRRGLVDEGFFARVVAARPDLEEQVRRVAGMW